MQALLEKIKNIIANDLIDIWVYEVFAVVFGVLILAFIARRVLVKLADKAEVTCNPWDNALINAVRKPLRYTIIIIGISYAAQIAGAQADAEIFNYINTIRYVLIVSMMSWALMSFVARFENGTIQQKFQTGQPVDRTSIHAIGKVIRTAIFITTALIILQTLGFSVSGVLAFGGIGGIAIGFAAKDLLSNFFGGLMIFLDRPFTVGDWISSPDRKIEGIVESIGWRLTTIRTFDKRPLFVPNSIFATIAVENPSRMSHRRIYETIGLRYDDVEQMERIVEDVRSMLKAHEEIDQSQTMIVNFNAFNESSVDFFVYTFTKTTNWVYFHEVKQDVLLRISNIVLANGAEMAFPTTTMFLQQSQQLNKI